MTELSSITARYSESRLRASESATLGDERRGGDVHSGQPCTHQDAGVGAGTRLRRGGTRPAVVAGTWRPSSSEASADDGGERAGELGQHGTMGRGRGSVQRRPGRGSIGAGR
jgi:hypothetical protein